MKTSHRTHSYRLRAPWCAAVIAVAAFNGLQAQETAPPAAASSDEKKTDADIVELDPIEVTGSRIKRLDAETVSPVIELKAADMAKIGYPTVGDALRALPFNSGQALTPTDSGTSFTPGVSTINLRGLGNNQTLVLVNGRRAVPYASPGFNGLQTVFDFNSLPQAAIESVEILKDGGSAIYGSDAVAGVVNVKMRKDYQGLSTSAEIGNYYNTDGLLKKASLVAGINNAKTNLFFALSWAEQNAVEARDVKWTADADKTSVAHKAHGRYTATGWENVSADEGGPFASEQDYLASIEALDAVADGNFDNRSSRGFPGYVTVPGRGRRTFTDPTNTPTDAGSVGGANLFNYQTQAGLFPAYRTFSAFTSINHDFSSNLRGFAEISFNRYQTTPAAAATPVDIESEHGLDVADPMILPYIVPFDYDGDGVPSNFDLDSEGGSGETAPTFANPFNPFGVDINNGRRRLVELAQRINDVTSDTPRLVLGLGGDLSFLEGWTWETSGMYTRNDITNLNRGSVSDSRMQQSLYGLTRLGNGSLVWDPATHPTDRVYFNWFGNNEPAFAKFLEIQNPTSDSLTYWSYDVTAGGRLFDLPAGPVGLALGFEHLAQKQIHTETDLNATAGIVGGSEGSSFQGQRSVKSLYAEINVPVLKQVELQLAARYEDYSDEGFQDKARPKVGLKVRPVEWLVLRGSYSQSFKAPDLAYLYSASSTSFTSFQVVDPVTGDEIDAIQIVTSGNADLNAEVSDIWYGGVVFEAPERGFLKGLELSAEYFFFDQTDALAQLSDFYGYAEFFQENASGNPLFAGKVIRDPGTNEVLYIRDDYTNISSARYKGFDFGLHYTRVLDNWGTFSVSADATKITSYTLDGGQIAGSHLTPKWNGTVGVNWSRGDWNVSVYEIMKGTSRRDLSYGNIYTDDDELFLTYNTPSQFITNFAVSYRGFGRSEITVGATNVLNSAPPVDPFEAVGTTPGVNYVTPGFWYVRLSHDF